VTSWNRLNSVGFGGGILTIVRHSGGAVSGNYARLAMIVW